MATNRDELGADANHGAFQKYVDLDSYLVNAALSNKAENPIVCFHTWALKCISLPFITTL